MVITFDSDPQAAQCGLRIADVMTPHPDLASGWHSVRSLRRKRPGPGRTRSRSSASTGLTGIVTASQLAAFPGGNGSACVVTRWP